MHVRMRRIASRILLVTAAAAALAGSPARGQLEGLVPPPRLQPLPAEALNLLAAAPAPAIDHPPALDWRDAGIVTPPKHQLRCGACWAFAAVACVEAMAIKAGADPGLDLSEQYPISCDTLYHSYGGHSYRNDGCCGGTVLVFEFMLDWPAIPEAFYAYGDGDFDGAGPRACSAEPDWNTIPCPTHLPPHTGWRVVQWHPLPADPTGVVPKGLLMDAIQQGPVWLGYEVFADFVAYYVGGDPGTPYRRTGGASLGFHAVLLIGYEEERNAWIVKNSWGAETGPFGDGTFMIDRDLHNCRFGMNAAIVTAVSGGEVALRPCCVGEDCQMLSSADCIALGGDWMSEAEACEPNPCATPVRPTSLGRLKDLFR